MIPPAPRPPDRPPAAVPAPAPAARLGFRPWRSAVLGWLAAVALLAAGVPPFLRMPLWCDANLYDMAAHNILTGGVHYRDVFDTNLPGFVWLVCGVRAAFGPSPEALRAVDLGVLAAVVFAMLRFARAAGATAAGRAWAVAGVAAFYPFVSEFNHLQRDVWMMLPVLAASLYRYRRVRAAHDAAVTDWSVFRGGVLEGAVWGLGFCIKPHVVVMAFAVWLGLLARFAGSSAHPFRRTVVDLVGIVLGVAAVLAAGVGWLVWTGTWEPLVEVFEKWNTTYIRTVMGEFIYRYGWELSYHPPWSLLTLVAVPLAFLNVWDGRPWSRRWQRPAPPSAVDRATLANADRLLRIRWERPRPADDAATLARAAFAAVYIGWVAMALFLQRQFHYAHVPEVLLAFGLFAANRWAVTPVVIAWCGLTSGLVLASVETPASPEWQKEVAEWHRDHNKGGTWYHDAVTLHPAANPDRAAWWPACFRAKVPPELRNAVAFDWDFHAGVDSVQLAAVEDYLRERGVGDRELICWHDSPHALYRRLNVKPAIPFMHVTTASEMGPWQYDQVKAALHAAVPPDGPARFAVGDLYRVMADHASLNRVGADGLPVALQAWQRDVFPWNQRVVFRSPSGRYVVVAIERPPGECHIPSGPGRDD